MGACRLTRSIATHALSTPLFATSGATTLYTGVALQQWAQQQLLPGPEALGSSYQVVNGLITERLGGTGPGASALGALFIGTAELVPQAAGGWTGAGYTGIASLASIQTIGVVPLPSSWLLIAGGLVGLARRRDARPGGRFGVAPDAPQRDHREGVMRPAAGAGPG